MLRHSRKINSPTLANFKLPLIKNEKMFDYAPGSKEAIALKSALLKMKAEMPFHVPLIVGGKHLKSNSTFTQSVPFDHKLQLCSFSQSNSQIINMAIDSALAAKPMWEAMPFNDRASIFLKAADLLSGKYRYEMMAATMLGQGKNVWQAEIDAAAELADFWRFNCKFAEEIYNEQPSENSPGLWNRVEYRALEGFVLAISPFNFTAIGGNLACAPALMGNVVLWKPSPMAMYSNYLIMKILKEAGLPDGVIQFIPGDPVETTTQVFTHPEFAGLHFTGSTSIFTHLWQSISDTFSIYNSYPRIVGETGGKNMHFLHEDCDIPNAVNCTIRGAFEYQGQKCSATSRLYVPDSIWPEFKKQLLEAHSQIKQGCVTDFRNFMGAVIDRKSFEKITGFIKNINSQESEIIAGGKFDDSKGYYIEPTIIVTSNPDSNTMTSELFGPVLTIYVYPSDKFTETLKLADKTTQYALTGAIFSTSRSNIIHASNILRNSSGNFYINDKCTGAVVGQQPFGGGRASGTNDKAGSKGNLLRWVSPRTIKESFVPIDSFEYPSNK